MCGRYTLARDPVQIAKRFKVGSVALEEFKKSYNIPPSSKVPVVVATEELRRLESAAWGLKRKWAPNIANLRTDKLLEGPFENLLTSQRCLVPADGFYEWGMIGGKKMPMYFRLPGGELFSFAAIYDEGEPKTFSIFTTTPHPVVAKIHDRSPVILTPEAEDAWLDPNRTDKQKLFHLLMPYTGPLESRLVSTAVNLPKNNAPELIQPVKGPNR